MKNTGKNVKPFDFRFANWTFFFFNFWTGFKPYFNSIEWEMAVNNDFALIFLMFQLFCWFYWLYSALSLQFHHMRNSLIKNTFQPIRNVQNILLFLTLLFFFISFREMSRKRLIQRVRPGSVYVLGIRTKYIQTQLPECLPLRKYIEHGLIFSHSFWLLTIFMGFE